MSVLFSLNTFLILRLPTIPNQIIVHFYKLTVMSLWYLARLDHSTFYLLPPVIEVLGKQRGGREGGCLNSVLKGTNFVSVKGKYVGTLISLS